MTAYETCQATSLKSIRFLTPGNYPDHAPGQGLDETLQLFELAERLGYCAGPPKSPAFAVGMPDLRLPDGVCRAGSDPG